MKQHEARMCGVWAPSSGFSGLFLSGASDCCTLKEPPHLKRGQAQICASGRLLHSAGYLLGSCCCMATNMSFISLRSLACVAEADRDVMKKLWLHKLSNLNQVLNEKLSAQFVSFHLMLVWERKTSKSLFVMVCCRVHHVGYGYSKKAPHSTQEVCFASKTLVLLGVSHLWHTT